MGIFREINAENNAKNLESVLRAALKDGSLPIKQFVKKYIIPIYEDEVGESWGSYKIPADIKKAFELTN